MQKTAPSRAIICSARICPQAGTRSALWSSNVVRFLFGERYSGAMGASRLRIGAMPTLWGLPWGTHATLTRSLFRNLSHTSAPAPIGLKSGEQTGRGCQKIIKSQNVKSRQQFGSLVRGPQNDLRTGLLPPASTGCQCYTGGPERDQLAYRHKFVPMIKFKRKSEWIPDNKRRE